MTRRLIFIFLSLALMVLGLAQEEDPERRIISIDSSGGTQSGNLRFGPLIYEHPDPEGIVATDDLRAPGPIEWS
jgi:hypothetical protein